MWLLFKAVKNCSAIYKNFPSVDLFMLNNHEFSSCSIYKRLQELPLLVNSLLKISLIFFFFFKLASNSLVSLFPRVGFKRELLTICADPFSPSFKRESYNLMYPDSHAHTKDQNVTFRNSRWRIPTPLANNRKKYLAGLENPLSLSIQEKYY